MPAKDRNKLRNGNRITISTAIVLLISCLLAAGFPPQTRAQTVTGAVKVGDGPRGLAANPATNRIYVANENGDSVSVIDGGSDTVIATVPVGDLPSGVAVNPDTNRIHVTSLSEDKVYVING